MPLLIIYANLNTVTEATICGLTEPDPERPLSRTVGTNDVWLTTCSLAAKPDGERPVGDTAISAGLM